MAVTISLVPFNSLGSTRMNFISFNKIDDMINKTNKIPDEIDRIKALCEVFVKIPNLEVLGEDPFSNQYRKGVEKIWKKITKKDDYDAKINEKSPFIENSENAFLPSIYTYGDSNFLGQFFAAFGAILKVLNVKRNDSVLEYGPGDGQISIALTRMGCKVSVVDIEERYLQAIKSQCNSLNVTIEALEGQFGDNFEDGRKYDRILFFEAFHHSLDHQKIMAKFKEILKSGGFVVFAGEPIVDPHGPWSAAVPFAWGPRLDGLSIRAMRTLGWCELGFQRPYFIEMLLQNGYNVEYIDCPHAHAALPIKRVP